MTLETRLAQITKGYHLRTTHRPGETHHSPITRIGGRLLAVVMVSRGGVYMGGGV